MKRKLSRRERIQYIHDRVAGVLRFHDFKYNPGYWAIAQELGVPMRTIQADADYMRDELSLPILYDERRACLCYRGDWWSGQNQLFELADTIASIAVRD